MNPYLFVLNHSPFFSGMSDEEIESVLHCIDAKVSIKNAGEYIFRAGDRTAAMGLVLSGSVLIMQEDLWGRRNIMAKITSGDFFAEPFAVTPGSVFNISVIADENCEILLLNINRLLSVCPAACEHHGRLIRNLVSVFANKLLMLNDKITHMSKRTTKEKLLGHCMAANGLYLTIDELARFGHLLLHEGSLNGKQIVPKKFVIDACLKHIDSYNPLTELPD